MIAEVYDALKSAGADDEKARAAAMPSPIPTAPSPKSASVCGFWNGRLAPIRSCSWVWFLNLIIFG
jgi:hypothetical protein